MLSVYCAGANVLAHVDDPVVLASVAPHAPRSRNCRVCSERCLPNLVGPWQVSNTFLKGMC